MSSFFYYTRELFSKESFIILHKKTIKALGICEAIFLSELLSKHRYFEDRNMLQDGWFFNTTKDLEDDTTLSEYQQRTITNKLVDMKILQFKLQGMPAKKYFKFNQKETGDFLKEIINNPKYRHKKASKEITDLTLKKSNCNNKTNTNKNNSTINSCNRAKSPVNKLPVKKITKEVDLHSLRLIQYWSSFDQTSTHDTNYPYNKNCLQIVKLLSQLQKGTFCRNKNFDIKWLEESKIPEKWFKRAWTIPELKIGIKNASKYALEGYYSQGNKQNYKSLLNIIYNPRKNISLLLAVMQEPPQSIENNQFENPFPKTTADLIKNPIWPKDYQLNEKRLVTGLIELEYFSDNLIQDSHNLSHKWFGDLPKILKEYLAWIDEQDWITDINETLIGTGNKVFRRFIEFQSNEIGVQIRSKGWK